MSLSSNGALGNGARTPGRKPRVQFILKCRDNRWGCDPCYSAGELSSGLWNSARFVCQMLSRHLGCESTIEHVVDNNEIDRVVTAFRPDIVVIEAYWVVPEKFAVLTRLHPKVAWIVRNHSATPFASMEGIIMDWSLRYMDHPNVVVACNDARADREFRNLIALYKPTWTVELIARCVYLPNYYPAHSTERPPLACSGTINVGCFGAVRPLKNHLIQAVAAIEYAELIGKRLRFHINATRVEGRGDAILDNLRKLFALLPHELVEHAWISHDDFIELVRSMDLGAQVSYSETFNIVSADMVVNDVPIVTSSEVRWVDPTFHADPNDSRDIVATMHRAMTCDVACLAANVRGLECYNDESMSRWDRLISGLANRS